MAHTGGVSMQGRKVLMDKHGLKTFEINTKTAHSVIKSRGNTRDKRELSVQGVDEQGLAFS